MRACVCEYIESQCKSDYQRVVTEAREGFVKGAVAYLFSLLMREIQVMQSEAEKEKPSPIGGRRSK